MAGARDERRIARRAARAAAARGRQVRRSRLHRAVRARADLRRDYGHPPEPPRARPRRAAGARAGERRRAGARRRAGVDARMSELLALGISHKTAPVALRERVAFTEQESTEVALQAEDT